VSEPKPQLLCEEDFADEMSRNYIRRSIRGHIAALEQERTRLRAALDPFARVARLNAPLGIPDDTPMVQFIPCTWPVMADCRKADEALAPKG
jgi:hypothetical protein